MQMHLYKHACPSIIRLIQQKDPYNRKGKHANKDRPQDPLDFGPSSLKVTRAYYGKYQAVDRILSETPAILDIFHRQVAKLLSKKGRKRTAAFTSDQLLRAILVMEIEGLPYREAVIRIDDSGFLRRFVRIYDGPTMDYSLLCKAYKVISPEAWKQMNQLLGRYAIGKSLITGDTLRADTTACETNIHFPTDASLLWDSLPGPVPPDLRCAGVRPGSRRSGSGTGPQSEAIDAADRTPESRPKPIARSSGDRIPRCWRMFATFSTGRDGFGIESASDCLSVSTIFRSLSS